MDALPTERWQAVRKLGDATVKLQAALDAQNKARKLLVYLSSWSEGTYYDNAQQIVKRIDFQVNQLQQDWREAYASAERQGVSKEMLASAQFTVM